MFMFSFIHLLVWMYWYIIIWYHYHMHVFLLFLQVLQSCSFCTTTGARGLRTEHGLAAFLQLRGDGGDLLVHHQRFSNKSWEWDVFFWLMDFRQLDFNMNQISTDDNIYNMIYNISYPYVYIYIFYLYVYIYIYIWDPQWSHMSQ